MVKLKTFIEFINENNISNAADEVITQMEVNKLTFMNALLKVSKDYNIPYKEIQKELSKRSTYKRKKKEIKTSIYDDFLRDK